MKGYGIPLLALACLALSACSACLSDRAVVTLWGGDLAVPTIGEVRAVSPECVEAAFSAPVTAVRAEVVPGGDSCLVGSGESDSPGSGEASDVWGGAEGGGTEEPIAVSWESLPDGSGIRFSLARSPGPGVKAILSGTVRDANGDTLSFAAPFTGYNDRVPRLRISEIRTDYSKPKVEYIEIVALTAGNLGGVEIFNALNGDVPVRELPAVEVKAGEYIVWHFRSVEEGLVNEMGSLDESGGTNSCPTARDFWDTQARSPFKGTNVVWLRERRGGAIMDALLCAESGKADWPTDAARAAALEAVAAGAWRPGALIADAASSDGMTPTRTLARDPALIDTDSAADWKVCPKGKCSPGKPNVPH